MDKKSKSRNAGTVQDPENSGSNSDDTTEAEPLRVPEGPKRLVIKTRSSDNDDNYTPDEEIDSSDEDEAVAMTTRRSARASKSTQGVAVTGQHIVPDRIREWVEARTQTCSTSRVAALTGWAALDGAVGEIYEQIHADFLLLFNWFQSIEVRISRIDGHASEEPPLLPVRVSQIRDGRQAPRTVFPYNVTLDSDSKHAPVREGKRKLLVLVCSICGKTFKTKRNRVEHESDHRGVRYVCRFCNKNYRHIGSKNKHERRVHPSERAALMGRGRQTEETDEKPWEVRCIGPECGCGSTFKSEAGLANHLRYVRADRRKRPAPKSIKYKRAGRGRGRGRGRKAMSVIETVEIDDEELSDEAVETHPAPPSKKLKKDPQHGIRTEQTVNQAFPDKGQKKVFPVQNPRNKGNQEQNKGERATNKQGPLSRSPGESEESRNPLPFKKRKEDPQGGTKPEHRDHSKAATENDPREGVPVQQPQSKGNREREKGAVAQEKVKGKVVHVRQPQRKGNRETEKGAVAQENVKGKVVPVRQPPSKGNQEEEKGEMAQENRDPSCGILDDQQEIQHEEHALVIEPDGDWQEDQDADHLEILQEETAQIIEPQGGWQEDQDAGHQEIQQAEATQNIEPGGGRQEAHHDAGQTEQHGEPLGSAFNTVQTQDEVGQLAPNQAGVQYTDQRNTGNQFFVMPFPDALGQLSSHTPHLPDVPTVDALVDFYNKYAGMVAQQQQQQSVSIPTASLIQPPVFNTPQHAPRFGPPLSQPSRINVMRAPNVAVRRPNSKILMPQSKTGKQTTPQVSGAKKLNQPPFDIPPGSNRSGKLYSDSEDSSTNSHKPKPDSSRLNLHFRRDPKLAPGAARVIIEKLFIE